MNFTDNSTHPQKKTKKWLKLDNSAKIFPSIARKSYSTFFRFEVLLFESVYADGLRLAIKNTLKRYPLFQTCLKRGLFWYFLEEREHDPTIEFIDAFEPCRYEQMKGTNKPLWRVLAGDKRIAFEVSHILTDGIGAMEFFKTLLCAYYECCYKILEDWEKVRHFSETPHASEIEMSYRAHRKEQIKDVPKRYKSFQYPDIRGYSYIPTHIVMNASKLKQAAKSKNTDITGFLTAVHLYAIQRIYKAYFKYKKKEVRELILVNLRSFFNSQTVRNFFLFVMLNINFSLGHYNFDEIINKINAQMQNLLDKREICKEFSHYVSLEDNPLHRVLPWFIKNPIIRATQFFSGETKMIGSVSNIGRLQLPKPVEEIIEMAFLYPPPSRHVGRNISIIGHKNTISLTTGRYIYTNNVEREMTKILQAENIDVLYLDMPNSI